MPDPDNAPSTEVSRPGHPPAGRLASFAAGILGAAVALGFGELIEGISETIPSLVVAVAEAVVDYTPGDVVAFSISNVGNAQKTLLITGVVVVSLVVGGILGCLAARGGRLAAVGGFVLFGLIGGWAAARNPLSPALPSWLVALAAAALAAATTLFLVHRAGARPRPASRTVRGAADADGEDADEEDADGEDADEEDADGEDADEEDADEEDADGPSPERVGTRRSFFAFAAGAAVAALGLFGLGRSLRGESVVEQAREAYSLPSRDPAPTNDQTTALGEPQPADAVTAPSVADTPSTTQGATDTAGAAPTTTQAQQTQTTDTEQPAPTTTQAQQVQTTDTEQPAPTTTQTQQTQTTDTAGATPTTTQAQQTQTTDTEQPAPTTTQTQQVQTTDTEQPAPTTTQPPEPEPAPTTTQPPEPEPAPTTTQPPEPEPAPTTTQPPRHLSVQEQVARLDTLDDDVPGISPYITPITPRDDFYRIDTALSIPQVDPSRWSLRFTGMVDRPFTLDFDDILAMDLSDHVITLACVSNPVGGPLVDNAVWTGIPLAHLLERAGAQRQANQVVGRSVDDFTAGFPTGVVHDGRNAILAIGMNNELLPAAHGFPARLVVAGLYGYVSAVKWIDEIRLTTWDAFDGYWVPRGWSKRGPMKTQSRIDIPKHNASLTAGEKTSIAGIAWAPTRGITRVETKIGYEDWVECRLGQALGDESWVQWHREWTPTRGRHRIRVRATDGKGVVQSSLDIPTLPNGAEGWHTIAVRA